MKKFSLFILLALLCLSNAFAQDTLWQRDWYMGEGQLTVTNLWNYEYWQVESLNTENHYIASMARHVNYGSWVRHTLHSGRDYCAFERAIPVDFDRDGDLDVVGIREGDALVFWENMGDWTFEESTLVEFNLIRF